MASLARPFDLDAYTGGRKLVEAMEAHAAGTMEQLVGGEAFSELLVHLTENAVALMKLRTEFWELIVRSTRFAGRADVTRLARQLSRAEDKLELLLQAVERLEESLQLG